jgi:hypothetical protein
MTNRNLNSRIHSLVIISILFFQSCEQNVDIFTESKFTPVIYCLLNPQESVQTLRVSRVFQDRAEQTQWEIKYDDHLEDSNNRMYIESIDLDGQRHNTYFEFSEKLQPVGNHFADTRLYTCQLKPLQASSYQLYVYFPEIKTMASAKIQVLSPINLIDPSTVPGRKMVIDPTQPYVIRWQGAKGSAYFQGILHINYLEKKLDEIQGKTVSMIMDPVLQYPEESVFSQNLSGNHLLKFLEESIPVTDSVKRKLLDFDFTFIYGGEELALFTNSGINPLGLSDRVSDYSNIDNARGVFSSISSLKVYGIPICSQSADTIAINDITKNLNFVLSDEEF